MDAYHSELLNPFLKPLQQVADNTTQIAQQLANQNNVESAPLDNAFSVQQLAQLTQCVQKAVQDSVSSQVVRDIRQQQMCEEVMTKFAELIEVVQQFFSQQQHQNKIRK